MQRVAAPRAVIAVLHSDDAHATMYESVDELRQIGLRT